MREYSLMLLFFLFCFFSWHKRQALFMSPATQRIIRHFSIILSWCESCKGRGYGALRAPLLYAMLFCALLGCGPKVVGEDIKKHYPSGGLSPAHDPAELRYPASGKRIDKTLYMLNDPERMYVYQGHFNQYLKEQTNNTSEKYQNLQPRQESPFR